MSNEKISVREACRRRMPLEGADAQALEHAITITERERDQAREDLDGLRVSSGLVEAALAKANDRLRIADALLREATVETSYSLIERIRAYFALGNVGYCTNCKEKL